MINLYGEQSREALGNSLTQNKKSASSRGLLYSGIKQGADASARGQQAGDVASYTQRTNRAADDEMGSLSSEAAASGLKSYGENIVTSQDAYADALERKRNNPAASIGKAVGQAAGQFLPF